MRLLLPVLTFRDESDDLEFVSVHPHRNAIPPDLWDQLFHSAEAWVDILVHAGRFLVERPDFIRTLDNKASDGVSVRIVFGDPDSESTFRSPLGGAATPREALTSMAAWGTADHGEKAVIVDHLETFRP